MMNRCWSPARSRKTSGPFLTSPITDREVSKLSTCPDKRGAPSATQLNMFPALKSELKQYRKRTGGGRKKNQKGTAKMIEGTWLTRRLDNGPSCLCTVIYIATCTQDLLSKHQHCWISVLINFADHHVSKLSQLYDPRRISTNKSRQIPTQNNKSTTSISLNRPKHNTTACCVV